MMDTTLLVFISYKTDLSFRLPDVNRPHTHMEMILFDTGIPRVGGFLIHGSGLSQFYHDLHHSWFMTRVKGINCGYTEYRMQRILHCRHQAIKISCHKSGTTLSKII